MFNLCFFALFQSVLPGILQGDNGSKHNHCPDSHFVIRIYGCMGEGGSDHDQHQIIS